VPPGGASIRPPEEPAPAPEGEEPRPEALAPHERCAHHAGRPAVARCDACGEPVCIVCAVPVRGRVLGPGCLAAELGDPALLAPPEPERTLSWPMIGGLLLAVGGTLGPWTRTGTGDRLLGAWVPDVRWSMVAAVAALGLIPVLWWSRSSDGRAHRLGALLGSIVLVASALAIAFPPTFQAASWGPWVSAAGGAIVTGVALAGVRSRGAPQQGV
jgi:hypothetical protein